MKKVCVRAVWKIPRLEYVLEHDFLQFHDRRWLSISEDILEQLKQDLHALNGK